VAESKDESVEPTKEFVGWNFKCPECGSAMGQSVDERGRTVYSCLDFHCPCKFLVIKKVSCLY